MKLRKRKAVSIDLPAAIVTKAEELADQIITETGGKPMRTVNVVNAVAEIISEKVARKCVERLVR